MILVKPARAGLVIPMPNGRILPAEGLRVPVLTSFWRRRLHDGDVIATEAGDDTAATTTES